VVNKLISVPLQLAVLVVNTLEVVKSSGSLVRPIRFRSPALNYIYETGPLIGADTFNYFSLISIPVSLIRRDERGVRGAHITQVQAAIFLYVCMYYASVQIGVKRNRTAGNHGASGIKR
jgi:hypothetical protein